MIRQANELSAAQKAAIEELMDRKLLDEETISLHAFVVQTSSPAERQAAADKLRDLLQSPRPAPDVSEEEFEAALTEAMRSVRPNYTPIE